MMLIVFVVYFDVERGSRRGVRSKVVDGFLGPLLLLCGGGGGGGLGRSRLEGLRLDSSAAWFSDWSLSLSLSLDL